MLVIFFNENIIFLKRYTIAMKLYDSNFIDVTMAG